MTPQGPMQVLSLARSRVSASNPHQLLVLMVAGLGADDADRLSSSCATSSGRSSGWPRRRKPSARAGSCRYRPSGATEVRLAGAAFLDMRARIERQIEQRTLMLSGVSHDLRTPLTRLKLGLSMMDDAEAAALARDVADMERLLDEFLAYARGDALDDPVATDPAVLVRQVVDDAGRDGIRRPAGRGDGRGHRAAAPRRGGPGASRT